MPRAGGRRDAGLFQCRLGIGAEAGLIAGDAVEVLMKTERAHRDRQADHHRDDRAAARDRGHQLPDEQEQRGQRHHLPGRVDRGSRSAAGQGSPGRHAVPRDQEQYDQIHHAPARHAAASHHRPQRPDSQQHQRQQHQHHGVAAGQRTFAGQQGTRDEQSDRPGQEPRAKGIILALRGGRSGRLVTHR